MPDVPPVPDGSAIITPNQQYAELQALRQSVDRLTATIDPALTDIRKDIHDHGEKLASHDDGLRLVRDRVTTIESSRVTLAEVRAEIASSKPKNVPAWVASSVAVLALIASFITPLIRA